MKLADVFAGAGGLSLGFSWAGATPVWGGEASPAAAATYAEAFPAAEVVNAWLTGDEVPRVDVLVGGPPCQPYSTAGREQGACDVRDGFGVFLRALELAQPRALCIEEVPQLVTRHAEHFARILDRLQRADYRVAYKVLNAADYGVPQRRQRVFIVGFRQNVRPLFRWPEPQPPVTIAEALGDLGTLPWFGPGPTRHSRPVPLDEPLHGARILDLGRGGTQVRSKTLGYKLQRPDDQSDTVTVSAEVKGSEHALRIAVGSNSGNFQRRLATLEIAALQTFPPDYPWQGTEREVAAQIGNAVPPMLAYHVATSVLDA